MTEADKPDSQLQQYLATSSPEVDFALALSRTIDSIRENPAHLRDTVYELARIKLLEQSASASAHEAKRLSHALELAINRVEAFSLKDSPLHLGRPPAFLLEDRKRLTALSSAEPGVVDIYEAQPDSNPAAAKRSRRINSRQALSISGRYLGAAIALAGIFFTLIYLQPRSGSTSQLPASGPTATQAPVVAQLPTASGSAQTALSSNTQEIAAAKARLGEAMRTPNIPLPTHYGIFAVSDGKLYELEPLSARAPDPRINISAQFTTESQSILPNGQVQFIVFRRDLVSSAPDRLSARVVAEVRPLAFDPQGKAIKNLEKSWVIRNIAFDFRVAPVTENPEMLMIKSENADFALSPGRYVLVLRGGQAFDFTIAGRVTDPAQCLEQIQAKNGMFYAECKL